jgi:hypothetical protein
VEYTSKRQGKGEKETGRSPRRREAATAAVPIFSVDITLLYQYEYAVVDREIADSDIIQTTQTFLLIEYIIAVRI